MFVGRLDPKTGAIREWPLPPVEKGDVPGARDIVVDKQDYPWFSMRVPGSKSVLHKFDPATGQVTPVEGAQGQFVALQPDGSHVWLGFIRVDTKTAKVDGDFRRPPNFKDRQAAGYGFVVNSLGNPFGTDFRRSEVDGVEVSRNEGGAWPTPTRWVNPRRGRIDAQDRFWFAEYAGEALAMFDTKAHTMQEWKLGPKYSTPYTATIPDATGRVYLPSNSCDCFFRVDTRSGEVVEYPMPGPPGSFDTKKVALDPTSTRPVLLFANTRNAQLMRVEPLE
jgi:streptogramin lyase